MDLYFGIVLLLSVSVILILIIFITKKETEDVDIVSCVVLGALVIVFLIAGAYILEKHCSPTITPIDVYRGKTTLEITYRDNIAIDSTVVWKEEIK